MLSDSELLELYRRMVLLRVFDERALVYHRQGRIGTYAIAWNHEAIQAGATFALGEGDWI
jgi:TPP-dependent pyruvate/acetoin dehydrogenase alpha subunit